MKRWAGSSAEPGKATMDPVAQAALSAYGLSGAVSTRISTREDSIVYRLDVSPRARYVLRIRDAARVDQSVLETQLAWLAAIAELDAVSVPAVVPTLEGRPYLTMASAGVDPPCRAVLFSWVPGERFPSPIEPCHVSFVGRALAHLHLAADRVATLGDFRGRRFDNEHFFGPSACLHLPPEKTGFLAEHYETLLAARQVIGSTLAELGPAATGLVHGDTHYPNLVLDGQRVGVFDFDEFGVGCQMIDLVEHLRPLVHWENASEIKENLLGSYADVRPLDDELLRHFDALLAAMFVGFLNWTVQLEDSRERAACLKWVPFCIEQIERHCGL